MFVANNKVNGTCVYKFRFATQRCIQPCIMVCYKYNQSVCINNVMLQTHTPQYTAVLKQDLIDSIKTIS